VVDSAELNRFREKVINCNVCFEGVKGVGGHCKHHEDVLGGFGAHRPIVVLSINPQDGGDDEVYPVIQALVGNRNLPLEQRLSVSNKILDVFASEEVDPSLGSIHSNLARFKRSEHYGLRTWLPRLVTDYALTAISGDPVKAKRLLADRFRFVELYKHATANEGALNALTNTRKIKENCPQFAMDQLKELKPIGIIIAGGTPIKTVLPTLLRDSNTSLPKRLRDMRYREFIAKHSDGQNALKMSWAHGKIATYGDVPDQRTEILLTFANSRRTIGLWTEQETTGTADVRKTIKGWLA